MSLKYLLASVCTLFLVPMVALAGSTLSGRITDTKGVPLDGAIVEVTDLKTGAAADSLGNYIIKDLPRGRYVVEVHQLSFATLTRTVTIDGDTRMDFQLSEAVIEKNAVVVTGASLASEERRNITPIQSISIKEMHERASTNVIDAITDLPGVSAVTTGPSVSKPVIRGLGFNRVVTLNNSVRQEGQQWGDEHGIEIDDYNVTRIEVLKGPASLAYGSDALAGVVNIISNPNVPAGKVVGNITGNYQTNAGLAAIHADLAGNNKGLSWDLYTTQKNAHDYHNRYDGYVYDSRFSNTDFGASVGINKSWGSSRLSFSSFSQRTGIPEGDRDSVTGNLVKSVLENGSEAQVSTTTADHHSYDMVIPNQRIDHRKIVLDNSIYLGNGGRIGATAGFQQNNRREYSDISQPSVPGLSLQLQTLTYDLKYYLPMLKGWQVSTGLNGMTQENRNQGTEFLVPDYNLFDIGIFAMAKRDWEKWTVAGGMRYDFRTMKAFKKTEIVANNTGGYVFSMISEPFTAYYANVSGSAGVGYSISKEFMLKLNFSSGYRAPNIAELSANGVHDGTVRYEIGNTSLVPENSMQTDIGVSWSSEHVMINASVFDNYVRKFIYIRKLFDSIPVYNNPDKYSAFMYTQGDVNLYGGELYVDFHPHPFDWLHLENTLSYVRGKLVAPVDGTDNVPYMPPARWLIELRAQKRQLSRYLRSAYAKVWVDMNTAQNNVFTAYNTETTTPGYTLLNAGIGADIVDRSRHTVCTVTVTAQNITDVAYQNALSRLRYTPENTVTGRPGIYNMGRNFSVVVSVPLDLK